MKIAKWKDRKYVIDIISSTFEDNPGSVWVLRENVNRKKAIRCLARYVFLKAYNRDGAYISSNKMGMALCYKHNKKSVSFLEICYLIRLTILYGSIKRLGEIHYREKYRENMRPGNGEYLYFWFFGVKKGGEKAGFEIARDILKVSKTLQLPIYLETAMERNMKVYSHFGYEMYHYWEEKDKDIRFWFMRRELSDQTVANC